MENKSNTEPIYVSGIYLNRVSEKAPEYIITNQEINVDGMIKWLQDNRHLANEKGNIKIVGKESKDKLDNLGNPKRYFQVDTYKPSPREGAPKPSIGGEQGMADVARDFKNGEVDPADVPF